MYQYICICEPRVSRNCNVRIFSTCWAYNILRPAVHYPFRLNVRHSRTASARISRPRNIHRGGADGRAGGKPAVEEKTGREKQKPGEEGGGGQSSQSLGHSQYGSLWCNRDAEAPCFHAFGENVPTLQQICFLFFPTPSQLDSLSPHILCLICQPKPSGPVGYEAAAMVAQLHYSPISTPADINHEGFIPASAAACRLPSRSRSILVCEKCGK